MVGEMMMVRMRAGVLAAAVLAVLAGGSLAGPDAARAGGQAHRDGAGTHSPAGQVLSVSASGSHTCAVKADHTLWCWGDNGYGELGDGTTASSAVPVQEHSHARDWAGVSAGGHHTCAVKADHSLWCWGYNVSGQLGIGVTGYFTTPLQVTGL